MEKKQTAMQALVDLLKVKDAYKECMPYIIDIIEEVYLPMEKEQMFDYIKKNYVNGEHSLKFHKEEFEQYYNETYNSKK